MNLVFGNRIRRKAVWGPKRTVLGALVALLSFAPLATTTADAASGKGKNETPGAPNHFATGYKLDKELESRAKDNTGNRTQVIVDLEPGAQLPPQFRQYARKQLDIINAVVLELPNGLLKKIAEQPGVLSVHYDRPIKTHNYRTAVTTGARTVQAFMGYTGKGVGIAVIDSGIAAWHDDLTNNTSKLYPYGNQRVSKFVDFVNGRSLPYDDNGHGTHVAGTILGNGYDSFGEKSGIAPDASLVALKVLDAHGAGTISNIIASLGWVAANCKTYNLKVVNMSVGAGVHESYWTDPLTIATKRVTDLGIIVVAAAGNMGKNANGQLQWGAITAPGNAPWALTVGASSHNGTLTRSDDTMADFSSSGPTAYDFDAKPDLVAPGVGTVSLAAPGSEFYSTKTPYLLSGLRLLGTKPYLALSGTSMASPVVAGTVALMLQANPYLTPNLVKAILQYTAQDYGYSPLRQGAGFLNTLGAVRLAEFYATAKYGSRMPTQSIWSKTILWGSHKLQGGFINPAANAWATNIVWGAARTQVSFGDNIVWGMSCGSDCDNIVWGMTGLDNIVWGVAFDRDNIVWGMDLLDDNIVWGMACGGADCDNIVWGMSDNDNIVWGMCNFGDNIVWGMNGLDNIVWATSGEDDVTWGSAAGGDEMFPDTATEPLPNLQLEFGDTVPLVAPVTNTISSLTGGL